METYIENKINILIDNGMRLGQIWSNVEGMLKTRGIDMFYANDEQINDVLDSLLDLLR